MYKCSANQTEVQQSSSLTLSSEPLFVFVFVITRLTYLSLPGSHICFTQGHIFIMTMLTSGSHIFHDQDYIFS